MRKIVFNNIIKTDRNLKERIINRITKTIERGDFVLGKSVQQFENKFAAYIGKK